MADFSKFRNEKYCCNIVGDTFRDNDNPFRGEDEASRRMLSKICRRNGGNPERGHYYPQLARFPGDPEAFVESKSDIRKLAAKRKLKCDGIVECDFLERKPPPSKYQVADDIVDRELEKEIKQKHGGKVSKAKRRELRDAVKQRLSGAGT